MATQTRKIGLSLGADLCWPLCFEDLVQRLDLQLKLGKDLVRFEVERTRIEPFSLRQRVPYDLIIDRLTYWYAPAREWIKKCLLMDGSYVWNNPWSLQAMEKHTTYCAMMRLGMPIPETWLVPPKAYDPKPDLQVTLERYAKLFDLGRVGSKVGYPLFMKPYDGGGWVGVSKVDDEAGLRSAYEQSGKLVMHLQQGIVPYDLFVRCIGLGPQTRTIRYDPSAPLHGRYTADRDFLTAEQQRWLEDITLTINAFFGWDFNSCEALLREGTWHPIDFANPCPDSQVTSLHRHFPWLVKAKLRWALFCAGTRRPMRLNLDWEPYLKIADGSAPFEEKLRGYSRLARKRLDQERFEEFCQRHLSHLDEVAWEYFGSADAQRAVRLKVEALYPREEWDEFSERFWKAIQDWRAEDRAARAAARPAATTLSGGAS